MNIEEMHASVLLKIDKVGSYSTANLIPGEIDDFINDAVSDYINSQRQAIRQYRYTEQGIEAQENLRTTIKRTSTTSSISSTSDLAQEGWEVPLSEFPDFDYFVSGTATINSESETLRHVSSGYLTDAARGSSLNFFDRGVPISVEQSRIIGFIPRNRSSVPNEVHLTYLDYPDQVFLDPNNSSNNVDLSLPEHTHRDIVDIAANKIIRSLAGQESSPQQKE
jgi:hypothetical protein